MPNKIYEFLVFSFEWYVIILNMKVNVNRKTKIFNQFSFKLVRISLHNLQMKVNESEDEHFDSGEDKLMSCGFCLQSCKIDPRSLILRCPVSQNKGSFSQGFDTLWKHSN